MCILVVDDSAAGREITEAMLLAGGYRAVSGAVSAADAFAFLAIGRPTTPPPSRVDLVLLDIVMPGIDGIEACACIRNDPRYSDVPIIMVTQLADIDSVASAFGAGATDYIRRPLGHVELLARVRSALKLKSELDRRHARERELLQFVSTWGDRRASHWIDEVTGLFVGDVAEAYLVGAANFQSGSDNSVIALAVDGLDTFRATRGEPAVASILSRVAAAVRVTAANIGVVAASYRSGLIVLIVPEMRSKAALELGEALRASIAALEIADHKSGAVEHVTASVAVATGQLDQWIDRAHLLTTAILAVPRISAAGGNRVISEGV